MKRRRFVWCCALFLVLAAPFATASQLTRDDIRNMGADPDAAAIVPVAQSVPEPAWGTTVDTALRIPAAAFSPRQGVYFVASDGTGQRYRGTTVVGGTSVQTDAYWDAPVYLPAGAKVTWLRADYCDTDASVDVNLFFQRTAEPSGGGFVSLGTVTSSGTPGCVAGFADLSALNINIDNATYSYWVRFRLDSLTSTQKIRGAVIYYRLQVSPGPLIATFQDVPTSHPFYRFIEALNAAGITGGCSQTPPQYCPDAPITRGEMAVFLAAALGLHWTP